MDTRHITPVSGRTRSQMNLSYRKESSRTPEASGGPNSVPKVTPNAAVGEVEFLLVDRDGTVRKKFYFDEMVISSMDSEDKGKETVDEGTTTLQPIILSDDDEHNKQGSKESILPLEKRQKFDEQQLPGLPMNSSLKGVDAQSFPRMKGDRLFKDMKMKRDMKFHTP